MGGSANVRIGQTVKGADAWLDEDAAAAWEAAADLAEARLGIDLRARILQALGDADASAGTHGKPPVAVDVRIWYLTRDQIEALVALLRECGFAATWFRDWTGNQHIHAACDIGIWSPARYQVYAVKAGYNGLGSGGRGGKDYHPAPSAWRTAQTGAAWARQQLEDEMALSHEDKVWIKGAVRDQLRWFITKDRLVTVNDSKWSITHVLDWLRRKASDNGTKLDEADVIDEDAITGGLLAGLVPEIRDAVAEAAGQSTDPDVIAEAVARKLGTALTAG